MPKDRKPFDHTENSGKEALNGETGSRALKYFTTRQAAAAFTSDFLDKEACRAWILKRLHQDARCPDCRAAVEGAASKQNFWAGARCICRHCGRKFMAVSGTFLQGSQLHFRQVFMLAVLINLQNSGLDIKRIASIIGISPDTVRIWIKKFGGFEEDKVEDGRR